MAGHRGLCFLPEPHPIYHSWLADTTVLGFPQVLIHGTALLSRGLRAFPPPRSHWAGRSLSPFTAAACPVLGEQSCFLQLRVNVGVWRSGEDRTKPVCLTARPCTSFHTGTERLDMHVWRGRLRASSQHVHARTHHVCPPALGSPGVGAGPGGQEQGDRLTMLWGVTHTPQSCVSAAGRVARVHALFSFLPFRRRT